MVDPRVDEGAGTIPAGAGRGGRRLLASLGVLLPLVLLLSTGFAGLDFGRHFDENDAFIQPLRGAVQEQGFLPHRYNYPSLGFALTYAALAPEALASLTSEQEFGAAFKANALRRLPADEQAEKRLLKDGPEKDFLLRLRGLFLIICSASLLWVHLAVLARGGSAFEALLASSLLGLSFEVAYHLRWVAPDGLLLAAGALTLLLGTLALRGEKSVRWSLLAAAAAGLACGSKYTGGLLLLPVLTATFLTGVRGAESRMKGLGRGLLLSLAGLAVFAVVFTLTTPGVLWDSEPFWEHVKFERRHYTEQGHGLHTVAAGWEHLGLMLRYLALQGLSRQPVLAGVLFLLALLGAGRLVKEDRKNAALLLLMPLVYVAYLSGVRVFVVRNLLVLLPFLAILAARGGGWLVGRWPEGRRWIAATALLGTLYAVNASTLVGAAGSISAVWPYQALRDLADDLRRCPDELVFATPSVRRELASRGLDEGLDNLADALTDDVKWVATFRDEIGGDEATRWGFSPDFIRWYGPQEVNLTYYPTWDANKLILVRADRLPEYGLLLKPLLVE